MMKNKRGWIRIVEAFIAVMLITTVMISFNSVQKKNNGGEDVTKRVDAIMDQISENNLLRQDILNNNDTNVKIFIGERLSGVMNFTVRICEINDICSYDTYQKNVYARERIISSTLQRYSPRKLKLFVWEK